MRIHSNYLKPSDIHESVRNLPGVYVEVSKHGSRSHSVSYEVRLTGTSTRRTMDNQDQAATWDEWGVFFARLFNLDANMLAGSAKNPNYANAADFHHKTGTRFAGLEMPSDTHQQHRWDWDGAANHCTKCTAVLNR